MRIIYRWNQIQQKMSMRFMGVMKMNTKEELVVYLDEDGVKQEKWFIVLDRESRAGIKVLTGKNKMTIPHSRIFKIKEKITEDE